MFSVMSFEQRFYSTLCVGCREKEKVTNEVKALAEFKHLNIVRYYCSWFESQLPSCQVRNSSDTTDTSTSKVSTSSALQSSDTQGSTSEQSGDMELGAASRPRIPFYIQMELCQRKTLKERLDAKELDHDKLNIFNQILSAVDYIHKCHKIHCDLKVWLNVCKIPNVLITGKLLKLYQEKLCSHSTVYNTELTSVLQQNTSTESLNDEYQKMTGHNQW